MGNASQGVLRQKELLTLNETGVALVKEARAQRMFEERQVAVIVIGLVGSPLSLRRAIQSSGSRFARPMPAPSPSVVHIDPHLSLRIR